MIWLLIAIYIFLLTFILLYSIVEFLLVIRFLRVNRKIKKSNAQVMQEINTSELPFVTIQLPVYNEYYVVERLIRSVSALNYPKDRFEIQLIDDSTDDSFDKAAEVVGDIKKQQIQIHHLRRKERSGYKAGALQYALQFAKGAFIVVFDADFVPDKEFLLRVLPFFAEEKVGVVQTRWGHLNKRYSMITRLQALALDAHFSIEQLGRNEGGHFMNFNGTAGVWRKKCIEDAGGWQADTLTEDLDLSYRAQLKGWKFKFLEEVVSPAELPADMNALKAQQFRWSKGGAECAVKHGREIVKAKNLSFATKIFAFFHLHNSFLFICIFMLGVLSIPMIYVVKTQHEYQSLFSLFVIYYLAIVFISLLYFVSEIHRAENKLLGMAEFIALYPFFLAFSMGLSLYNAIGVAEAYAGKKSSFIRTPKFNLNGKNGTWLKTRYAVNKLPLVSWLEALSALVFAFAVWWAVHLQMWIVLPYFGLLLLGFSAVFVVSCKHLSS